MAYRHYETEGLIIGHRNLGEANRLFQILTNDFGLINVLAQSVRHDRSKLRSHLQNFSFVNLSLIRGREYWRVVGVNSLDSPLRPTREGLIFFKKISLILNKLIHGEEKGSPVYRDLKQAFVLISASDEVSSTDLLTLEVFVLARILSQLGYLSTQAEQKDLFNLDDFSWAEVLAIKNSQLDLVRQINQALERTQL